MKTAAPSTFNNTQLGCVYKWKHLKQCYTAEIQSGPAINFHCPSSGCNIEVPNIQLKNATDVTTQ